MSSAQVEQAETVETIHIRIAAPIKKMAAARAQARRQSMTQYLASLIEEDARAARRKSRRTQD